MTEPQGVCRSFPIRRRILPWLVVLAGLPITAGLFFWAREKALDDFRDKFAEYVASRADRVVSEIDESMLAIDSVGRFCQGGHAVRGGFSAFVAPLLKRHPQLGSIAWVSRMTAARRVSHEGVAQKQGNGPFHITERDGDRFVAAGQREFYFPILYIQPHSVKGSPTGFDLGSDPALLSVLNRARDSGEPEVLPRLKRALSLDDQSAFSIALPVYQERRLSSMEDRRAALLGFVLGTVKAGSLASAFPATTERGGLTVEILDLSAGHEKKSLLRWSGSPAGSHAGFRAGLLPPFPSYTMRFFSGKEWGIRITPGVTYMENGYSLVYWLLLPAGAAITLLLTLFSLYLRTALTQSERMERVVLERTAELREHEQHLERLVNERTESLRWKSAFLEALTNTSADGILVIDRGGNKIFQNQKFVELWRIPQELLDRDNPEAWSRHIFSLVRDSNHVRETVRHLYAHPDESIHDEIEFHDGTVLERNSCPFFGEDGNRYGRVLRFRDITARKRAEDALRESEERYRIAIENSNDGISLAKDGRNHFVNRRFLDIFGYDRSEDALGDDSLAVVHPDDRGRVRGMALKRARGEQAPARYEFKGVKKNGTVVEVEVTVAPVTYRGNEVSLVYFHDITERKKSEAALRESENKFRDLAEKSIVGVYLIQGGVFRYVNSRFAEIHGYEPEELIDRMGVEETAMREDAPAVQESIRKRMSGELDLVRNEFRIVTKQGSTRDVEIYGTHTVYQGQRAIIGTLLDVTERKQTEAMLRWKTAFLEAQVNSSLDGILVVDSQGKHILQNQRTIDMWKIPHEVLGDPDHTHRFSHIVAMAKHAGQFRQKVDLLRRNPNQTSRDEIELTNGTVLDTYSCPVRGDDGNYYGRIWTFRDITELRHYWDMLENLSATDGLTDLPNRRRFDDFLSREWRRSMRDQSLLSLILMDIDFFKEFNDHYGHLAGDDCLRQVAQVLHEAMQRPGDLAARYGGEEFACILPDTDSAGAVTLANKIRDKLNETRIPHFFSSVADHVTMSFGVATIVPSKGESPLDLIQLADKLLYAAKQYGRDQIRDWQQSGRNRRVDRRQG